jgi:diguanylate cyclase (GGDEF)-like protein
MAYCDLAASRVKRARDGARGAAERLKEAGATSDEIDALSLLSRAATQLGRSVEAVEAGAMAVRLSEEVPQGQWTARANLSLAIAYAWAGAAAQADRAFEGAGQAARLHASVAGQLEVSVERLWGHLVRWARERQGQDIAPEFGAVAEVVELQRLWDDAPDAEPLTPGGRHGLRASARLAISLASVLLNEADAVGALKAELETEVGPAGMQGWMLAARSWLHAEVAVQEGQFEPAAMYASRMSDWARDAGNLPLASLGSQLEASIWARQGRYELALAAQAKCVNDERAIRVHHLDGRAELVESLWAARRSETRINDLAAEARKYEAWALQDALTGIANRRQLTQCLEAWSAQAADNREPLCAALIDVDRFKAINDSFSHSVGDEVLTTIARKMVDHVREADLAARWGGDEFAILFRNADVATAAAISERIEESVRAHDWSLVAPDLRVSISVGVVEAQPGDNKHSLVDRSDKAMYARKRARERADLTQMLSPLLVQQMTVRLRRARRVAFFVGSGTSDAADDPSSSVNFAAWDAGKRAAFGHVMGLQNQPTAFESFWREWRLKRRRKRPLALHEAAVKLSHLLSETLFVTERVDGILPMAGANNVIELYGNAFRNRCSACGRVWPSTDDGRCVPCGSPLRTIRPDIVLLGEEPDHRLLAGAELFVKRAEVVLVLDCDATTSPGAALLEKAKTRGAYVMMLGSGSRTHRGVADVSVAASPETVLNALCASLEQPGDGVSGSSLSAEGFAILAFLSGHGTDSQGSRLDEVLKWSNYEIATGLATIPWMFPLLTRSRMNPEAPMPTRDDFQVLAQDEHVRSGVRKAFLMMLRFYGFHWTDGRVEKGPSWQQGFANWALQHSAHDLFISRVLGSAMLLGLEAEARAFLHALEPEVVRYRGDGAAAPLGHWRLAVRG